MKQNNSIGVCVCVCVCVRARVCVMPIKPVSNLSLSQFTLQCNYKGNTFAEFTPTKKLKKVVKCPCLCNNIYICTLHILKANWNLKRKMQTRL